MISVTLSYPVFAEENEIQPRWTDYTIYEGVHFYSETGFSAWASVTLAFYYTSSGTSVKIHSFDIEVDYPVGEGHDVQILSSYTIPSKGSTIPLTTEYVYVYANTVEGTFSVPVYLQ